MSGTPHHKVSLDLYDLCLQICQCVMQYLIRKLQLPMFKQQLYKISVNSL